MAKVNWEWLITTIRKRDLHLAEALELDSDLRRHFEDSIADAVLNAPTLVKPCIQQTMDSIVPASPLINKWVKSNKIRNSDTFELTCEGNKTVERAYTFSIELGLRASPRKIYVRGLGEDPDRVARKMGRDPAEFYSTNSKTPLDITGWKQTPLKSSQGKLIFPKITKDFNIY